MQTEWKAALAAQRKRVQHEWATDGTGTQFRTALDNALRLARAIGAAEACDCDGVACPYVGDVEAIIRELGVE